MQFIYELQKFGIKIALQGDKLRLVPKERITPGVVEYVKKHKAEIIRELKARFQRVEDMTLEQLKQEDLAIRVYSKVFGEDIYLCSNEAMKRMVESEGYVCYLPDELKRLRGLGSESLKRLHTLKKEFDGTITNRRPSDDD